MVELIDGLDEIEAQIDSGSYRPGPWGEFLRRASRAPRAERAAIAQRVSRVSDKLHLAARPRTFCYERALAVEMLAMLGGLAVLALGIDGGSVGLVAIAAVVLATTFQPLLKTSIGQLLGIRYSYAYLWRIEPRFKMRYGSYLASSPWRRIALHAVGSVGSPFAWAWIAWLAAPSLPGLARVLWLLVGVHVLFTLVVFALGLAGVKRLGPLGLVRLTSPGGAGRELRDLLKNAS